MRVGTLGPVSYTHLDVYKRQELYSDHVDNKASHCARMIAGYYRRFEAYKGTQFVFLSLIHI